MYQANIVVNTFHEGGWVMYPILTAFFIGFCVILERSIWWILFKKKHRIPLHQPAREAVGTGDFEKAWRLGSETPDPYLGNLGQGMVHAHTSMLAAMQLDATRWIEKSEARMWVLSTMITLGPLLGLFGTVVGMMGSFASLGDEELAVTKVTGGIAEALIATAAGIFIAVVCLLPYNYFRKRVSVLRGSFERWINDCELLVQAAKNHGHDIEVFSRKLNSPR